MVQDWLPSFWELSWRRSLEVGRLCFQYIKRSPDLSVCGMVPPTFNSARLAFCRIREIQLPTWTWGKDLGNYLILKREFQLILPLASPLSSYLNPNVAVPLGEICGLLGKLIVSKLNLAFNFLNAVRSSAYLSA